MNIFQRWILTACAGFLVAETSVARAWDNDGHEAVTAVALQYAPTLRPKVAAVVARLPASKSWKRLEATGLSKHNPYQTQKSDPDGWVKALPSQVELAATFPDWARDYKGYVPSRYEKLHFYDLDFASGDDHFIETPNALTVLVPFEKSFRKSSPGEQAWELVWIMHIVGDLHQPLHCASRAVPGKGESDHGGNSITYERAKLHAFWDHLPDRSFGKDPSRYAASLLAGMNSLPSASKRALMKQAEDLNPNHWVKEGRELIVKIGYPADGRVPAGEYDADARQIADRQILLAGLRLSHVLEQVLR